MKRRLRMFALLLTCLALLAGCAATKPEPVPEPTPEPEPEPPIVVEPEPEPEPEPDLGLEDLMPEPKDLSLHLSYEEFFSVERPLGYGTEYGTLFNLSVRTINGTSCAVFAPYINDYNNYMVIYDKRPVSEVSNNSQHFYLIAEEKEIIQLDFSGENEVVLYTSEEERIDRLVVGTDVLFFRSNESVCRLYIPTGQVDILFTDRGIADYSFVLNGEERNLPSDHFPLSTTDFTWNRLKGEYVHDRLDGVKNFDNYAYSDLTKKSYLLTILPASRNDETQYLIQRGEDLKAMGIDPYAISYRTPDDDPHNFIDQ